MRHNEMEVSTICQRCGSKNKMLFDNSGDAKAAIEDNIFRLCGKCLDAQKRFQELRRQAVEKMRERFDANESPESIFRMTSGSMRTEAEIRERLRVRANGPVNSEYCQAACDELKWVLSGPEPRHAWEEAAKKALASGEEYIEALKAKIKMQADIIEQNFKILAENQRALMAAKIVPAEPEPMELFGPGDDINTQVLSGRINDLINHVTELESKVNAMRGK